MSEAGTIDTAAMISESSSTAFVAPSKSQDESSAVRLVIRAQLIPEPEPTVPEYGPWNWRAIAVATGILLVLLLAGIGLYRAFSSAPPASKATHDVKPQPSALPASAVSASAPGSTPQSEAATATANTSATAELIPLSPVHKVLPDVSRSSLQTIHGIIKVSIRVTVSKEGSVVATAVHSRGSSQYFERLALQAAKKWMFTPAATDAKRTSLVQFSFSRSGTSADAHPVQ